MESPCEATFCICIFVWASVSVCVSCLVIFIFILIPVYVWVKCLTSSFPTTSHHTYTAPVNRTRTHSGTLLKCSCIHLRAIWKRYLFVAQATIFQMHTAPPQGRTAERELTDAASPTKAPPKSPSHSPSPSPSPPSPSWKVDKNTHRQRDRHTHRYLQSHRHTQKYIWKGENFRKA